MIYEFIERHRSTWRVRKMCQVLNVSSSGYYSWRKRGISKREQSNRRLLECIKRSFEESRRTYGSPRILKDLRANGWTCHKNRVARLMRLHGISPKRNRRFKRTTNSKHSLPVAPNLLNRKFVSDQPASVWVSDITYIWTDEGWLYFAGVLDLYDRQLIGWSVSNRLNDKLTLDALEKALIRRRPAQGLIHHSDRGCQYASHAYRKLLSDNEITQSMSGKGNCYDNAVMESFFKTLKVELVYRTRFRTRDEAKRELFDYIEVYYNRKRRHSALGYMTPAEFEKMNTAS